MNGYVNIENKYSDAIMKFVSTGTSETTVDGIHEYLVALLSINKLLVANGSFIGAQSGKVEYSCVFNLSKNSDNSIIISILAGNVVVGIIVSSDNKITKIGG